MDLEFLREYCLSKPYVSEHMPFDDKALVFKVGSKMFALININNPSTVNLKCDPQKAMELREMYPEIQPGYHMSKVHWNTVSLIDNLSDDFIMELINHSYELVYSNLTRKEKESLAN